MTMVKPAANHPWRRQIKPKALWTRAFPEQIEKQETDGYGPAAKKFLEGKRCACCVLRPSQHVHHIRGRTGKLKMDKRFWLQVCAKCHDKIHRHMDWARAQGYLAQRGDWGRQP